MREKNLFTKLLKKVLKLSQGESVEVFDAIMRRVRKMQGLKFIGKWVENLTRQKCGGFRRDLAAMLSQKVSDCMRGKQLSYSCRPTNEWLKRHNTRANEK